MLDMQNVFFSKYNQKHFKDGAMLAQVQGQRMKYFCDITSASELADAIS
jgi:hypothetical protein